MMPAPVAALADLLSWGRRGWPGGILHQQDRDDAVKLYDLLKEALRGERAQKTARGTYAARLDWITSSEGYSRQL